MAQAECLHGRYGAFETVRMGCGDPIILLPGLAGGWRLMAPLGRLLSRRFQVVLVGLRGDRDGGVIGRQRPDDHAFDVAEMIVGMGLERPAVVGASYGGAVALELTCRNPRLVGPLTLLGAEARFHSNLGTNILARTLERFPLPRTSPFLNQFFNVLHGCRPEPGPLVDYLIQRCWDTDQAVVASRLRGLEGFDVSERLWRIDSPTLILGGTKDVVVPPSRQRELAEAIPGAVYDSIDGAGHVGFLTHRSDVAKRISRFVRGRVSSVCR